MYLITLVRDNCSKPQTMLHIFFLASVASPVAVLSPPGEELLKVLLGEPLVVLHVEVADVQVHL